MVSTQAVRAVTPTLERALAPTLGRAMKEALPIAATATVLAIAGKGAGEKAKLRDNMFTGSNGRFQKYLLGMTAALTFAANFLVETIMGKASWFARLAESNKNWHRLLVAAPLTMMAAFAAEAFAKHKVPMEDRVDETMFDTIIHRHTPTQKGETLQTLDDDLHTLEGHMPQASVAGRNHTSRRIQRIHGGDEPHTSRVGRGRHPLSPKETGDRSKQLVDNLLFAYQPSVTARSQALFNGHATTVASIPQFGDDTQKTAAVNMAGMGPSSFNPAFSGNPFMNAKP